MTEALTTPAVLAVDWGGTWCRMGLISRQGEILWQTRRPNPKGSGPDEYLALGTDIASEALAVEGLRAFAIGAAVAGPVDPSSGVLYQPPNLMALDGISLKRIWENRFGLPVVIGNDANMAAMGELRFGAGRDAAQAGKPPKSLFYITVSTGIGGGAVEGGSLILGANGLTAEIGHTTIDFGIDAPQCQCGKRGCLEAISSGTAIANYAIAALSAGKYPDSSLAAVPQAEMSSRTVVAAAAEGDSFAEAIIDRACDGLTAGLANVVHLFNPDLIILGGGVSAGLTELNLLPRISQGIRDRLMSDLHKAFELVPSRLGDNSGLLGAAAAAWEEAA